MQYGGYESSCSSSSSFASDRECDEPSSRHASSASADTLNDTVVMHLDVDAFYCQCEEIRNPSLASKPFAIGQKHIVVTCNYVARGRGVTKLMLRSKAKDVCPELIIIEGSDLEPYRRQSRKIYSAFRKEVASFPGGSKNLCKKGGMDEMYADISEAVKLLTGSGQHCALDNEDGNRNNSEECYVYGNDTTPSTRIQISEDQSGATAYVDARKSANGDAVGAPWWTNEIYQEGCIRQLEVAAKLAGKVHRTIRQQTQFRACVGISISPFLAKLASELKKPNSINALYPWRSSNIISQMPLRKIPGLGSRTLKSLENCLREYNGTTPRAEESYWKCTDLLRVPLSAVLSVCGDDLGNVLYQRCKGIDVVRIVDDDGGLNKTVSVENSHKRGSATTKKSVIESMEQLYVRLPRLLDDRKNDSELPDLAFPTTIRFTAREVDGSIVNKRRPFVTTSRQCHFDGRRLMATSGEAERSNILRDAVQPLMDQILFSPANEKDLNVTRLNIAVTGFADVDKQKSPDSKQRSVRQFFSGNISKDKTSSKDKAAAGGFQGGNTMKRKAPNRRIDELFRESKESCNQRSPTESKSRRSTSRPSTSTPVGVGVVEECKVDPSFLAALPPDIRAEVEQGMQQQLSAADVMSATTNAAQRNKKISGAACIDSFFVRKT